MASTPIHSALFEDHCVGLICCLSSKVRRSEFFLEMLKPMSSHTFHFSGRVGVAWVWRGWVCRTDRVRGQVFRHRTDATHRWWGTGERFSVNLEREHRERERGGGGGERETPWSLGGLSSANDRAGAAFTVGLVRGMAIAYAWSVYARRPLKEK